jgi:hypothetical protein
MTTDNKTLADVQPGGRVRLGDQAALKRLHAHLTAYPPPCNPEDVAVLGAALSAQPSPGGQDAPERCAECRHTTFEVHPDGHICVHCKLIVAARQPVGEPVGTVHSGKYASGMPWCEVEWHIPQPAGTKLYAAPAQAVDLGQFREAVAYAARSADFATHVEIGSKLRELLALIDGKAVGK